jgi:hypothetical protein
MNTYVVITIAGAHYPITSSQRDTIMRMEMDQEVIIDGCTVKLRHISEIMTTQKYYETYPKKRPAFTDNYKQLPGMGMAGVIKQAKRKDMLEGIIKGLKNYITSNKYQDTDAPKELLEMAENRLFSLSSRITNTE